VTTRGGDGQGEDDRRHTTRRAPYDRYREPPGQATDHEAAGDTPAHRDEGTETSIGSEPAPPIIDGGRFWEFEPLYDPLGPRPHWPIGLMVATVVAVSMLVAAIWLAWLTPPPRHAPTAYGYRAPSPSTVPAPPRPSSRQRRIPAFAPTPIPPPGHPPPPRSHGGSHGGAAAPHAALSTPHRGGGHSSKRHLPAPAPPPGLSRPVPRSEPSEAERPTEADPSDPFGTDQVCARFPSDDPRHLACTRAWEDYKRDTGL
jgi:hypothetical protein